MESGYEIECALTVKPEEFSPMYHYPNVEKSSLPAGLLGLDVKFCREDELESIVQVYAANGVRAMISGAIASDYQKTRIEKMCTELGLISFTPLWRKDQELVLDELISRGIRALLVSVS
ncbi:MAG: Dph6-related ATP pyrophosphatase, partial [Thermoplasmataceae archaeon]